MDEPRRMLDQTTSPLERALLREGRSYRAPSELRDNTLAALGIATSAGVLIAWAPGALLVCLAWWLVVLAIREGYVSGWKAAAYSVGVAGLLLASIQILFNKSKILNL